MLLLSKTRFAGIQPIEKGYLGPNLFEIPREMFEIRLRGTVFYKMIPASPRIAGNRVQMKRLAALFLLGCSSALAYGIAITPNVSAVKKGPIAVAASAQSLTISWDDGANQH